MTSVAEDILPDGFWAIHPTNLVRLVLTPEQQRYAVSICDDPTEFAHVATIESLVPDVVEALIDKSESFDDGGLYKQLARNPSLTLEQRERLLGHGNSYAKIMLMLAPHVEESIHHRIIDETDFSDRNSVRDLTSLAGNAKLSWGVQERLAEIVTSEEAIRSGDTYLSIQRELARNPNASPAVLGRISRLEGQVRTSLKHALSENPDLTSNDLAVPFLYNQERNGIPSSSTWAMGRAYLRAVRCTLDAETREGWDGLVETWTGSVDDLIEAIKLTSR